MLTLPGSTSAASNGYVPISTIQSTVATLSSTYSSYGGVSIWDASQAWANSGFASSLYSLVHSGSGSVTTSSSKTTTTTASLPTTSVTKTTTAATSSTKTTTSATSTATSTSCVTNGQSCSTEGKYTCSGSSYAVCNHGAWSLTGCPSGTTCIATTDGSSIYCGYATGSTTCSALSARALLANSLHHHGGVPKPYKSSQVSAQISVTTADADSFEAVVNARRTSTKAFGNTTTIEFNAPSNVKVTSVDVGTVRQVGNKVRIQIQNDVSGTMVLIATIKGTVSSGVFVAPNPASLRIK
jgi:chitinase